MMMDPQQHPAVSPSSEEEDHEEATRAPLVALDCLNGLSFSLNRRQETEPQEVLPNLMDVSDNSNATLTPPPTCSSSSSSSCRRKVSPDSEDAGSVSDVEDDGEITQPTATSASSSSSVEADSLDIDEEALAVVDDAKPCFRGLRFTYLAVILVIYLADGLQGTHLYKLYDDYGFSVAWLYCLGFCTGGVLSPVTGPWVDQVGRKRAAMIYCILEILINSLEQYPNYWCVIASRMIGGFTINLLQCVFETWLDSEFRKKGREANATTGHHHQDKEALHKHVAHEYELLMRDAVIVSNAAAIGSGYLSHVLSEWSGPVGPFRGAVVCTMAALVVVASMWTENYGGKQDHAAPPDAGEEPDDAPDESPSTILEFLRQAATAFMADMRMLRVGIVQGLSQGLVHFCLFLVARAHGFGQGSACRKEASHVGIGQAGRTRVWLDLYGVYGSLRLWWNHCSDSTTSGHQALDTHCQSFLVQRQGPPRSFGRLGPSHGGRVFGRHVLLCGGPHVVGTLPGIRTARLFTNPLCLLHL